MKEIRLDFQAPSKPGGSTHDYLIDELSNLSNEELVDIIIEIIRRIIKGRK